MSDTLKIKQVKPEYYKIQNNKVRDIAYKSAF